MPHYNPADRLPERGERIEHVLFGGEMRKEKCEQQTIYSRTGTILSEKNFLSAKNFFVRKFFAD